MKSIAVVVAYNTQVEMTKQFLDNLIKCDSDMNIMMDVILVQGWVNTSDEESIKHPLVSKYIKLKNKGFCKTLNAGLRAVTKDYHYIFMVGNDSFPRDNKWLPKLIQAHKETGAALINPADQTGLQARRHLIKKEDDKFAYCNMYPSVAWFIPMETFKKIGYLDEQFTGAGYFADDDYCRRIVNEYGENSIVVVKDVILDHLVSQEGKALNVTNQMMPLRKIYQEKWK